MQFIRNIAESIISYQGNNALFINNTYYTYKDFAYSISAIRNSIDTTVNTSSKLLGLVTNDDIETYAAIIAFWLEGKAYIPINPDHPIERNLEILNSTNTLFIFDSIKTINLNTNKIETLNWQKFIGYPVNLDPKPIKPDDLAYIIFTSGSTGNPKGVPITFSNLNSFINAINFDHEFKLSHTDRCLQMFELTFDFSVVSYIFPFLTGACIYTVPRNSIKYFYIYKLIKNHSLTVLSLVPSIIHYLRPYFSEINETSVRYCSFGGGALFNDIIKEWQKCIPNSISFNYYGPTESTIYTSCYKLNKNTSLNTTHNDIISIGKPLNQVNYIIIDKNNNELDTGKTGELALASPQLTFGYWQNKNLNNKSFFTKIINGKPLRFYKTGDLCIKNNDGNYLYLGRIDFQVKIRGYRIELSEIEYHAKQRSPNKVNMVAIDVYNKLGNAELGLAIESESFDTTSIFEYLKTKLPSYMIPMHIEFIKEFPHSVNGKIDRKSLRTYFKINE